MAKRSTTSLCALSLLVAFAACDGEIQDVRPSIDTTSTAPFAAAPGRMRRLTEEQYLQAIRDVFGDEITVPAALEPDRRTRGGLIEIDNADFAISARGTEQYQAAAFLVAEQVTSRDAAGCAAGDRTCLRDYLRSVGRRLWRRPLRSIELDELVQLGDHAGSTLGDPRAGLQYALAAMLQSPHFLFRLETGVDVDGEHRLSAWELASRLSFFVWNTAPDDALLDAAARGDLFRADRYAQQVDRLISDERARRGVRAIFADFLELDRLDSLSKDPTAYPHMSPELGPSAREETLRVVEWLSFDEPAPYSALYTTRTTFINRNLAALYGVRAPVREGFGRYQHEASSERAGILGHASVLALHSHFASSSATLRGIFVRRTLLCGEILAPPPNVDTSIPEPLPGAATLRDRVRRHLEDASCAGCHRRMDPLGLGLENFDAIGRFRLTDNGAYIDASGNVDGEFFGTPSQLGEVLARSDEAMRCAATMFYRYAHGQREGSLEASAIDEIHQTFERDGLRVLALVRAVATHDSFRLVGMPEVER